MEIRKAVKPIRVRQTCEECKEGEMFFTGTRFPTQDPKFPHQCDECGHEAIFRREYPTIEFEDIEKKIHIDRDVEILNQNGFDFLWIEGELWMWNIPTEEKAQKEMSDKMTGDVLVAGYGLGVVQKYLMDNENVKSVTTIESNPGVIEECRRHYGLIYGNLIIDNFYTVTLDQKFDCIYGDVWIDISTGNAEEYLQFKKRAKDFLKEGGRVLAWGQDFFEYVIANTKKMVEAQTMGLCTIETE